MDKKQKIYRGISVALIIAIVLGLAILAGRLETLNPKSKLGNKSAEISRELTKPDPFRKKAKENINGGLTSNERRDDQNNKTDPPRNKPPKNSRQENIVGSYYPLPNLNENDQPKDQEEQKQNKTKDQESATAKTKPNDSSKQEPEKDKPKQEEKQKKKEDKQQDKPDKDKDKKPDKDKDKSDKQDKKDKDKKKDESGAQKPDKKPDKKPDSQEGKTPDKDKDHDSGDSSGKVDKPDTGGGSGSDTGSGGDSGSGSGEGTGSGDGPGGGDKPGGGEGSGGDGGDTGSEDKPGTGGDKPGGPEDKELKIITDLRSQEIAYKDLEDDVFPFYAYLKNANGRTLRIKIINSKTPKNGKYLKTENDRDYKAKLVRGETNYIKLYLKNKSKTEREQQYKIDYVKKKESDKNWEIGDHPPRIETNLDNTDEVNNRNFIFTVQAWDYKDRQLYESDLEVLFDGQKLPYPTGNPKYEYKLRIPDPIIGDEEDHEITVRATDREGNSIFRTYKFTYIFADSGKYLGSAYIYLDMTTVGLGIFDEPYVYRIKQDQPLSYGIIEMLESYGFTYNEGKDDNGLSYLASINMGGLMDHYHVPDNLWAKIQQDELNLTGEPKSNSLGEFDITQGSGWMYEVNGQYLGRGFSEYYPNKGDTIYVRFTLAYGKDIGGYDENKMGGYYTGALKSYCGKWINGGYIDEHKWKVTKEPTCTEPGERVCSVCGDKEEIPALVHDWEEVERVKPADGKDGYILYRCKHCKEEKKEIIPWKDKEPEESNPEGESEPTQP